MLQTWSGMIVLALLVAGPPAAAQVSQSTGTSKAPPPATTEAKKDEDPHHSDVKMEFLNSDQAIWVNRSLNDSLNCSGYSVNAVFNERDAARVEGQMKKLYRPATISDLTVVQNKDTQPVDYKLNINGKVVDLQPKP